MKKHRFVLAHLSLVWVIGAGTSESLAAESDAARLAELKPLRPLVLDLASPTTAIVSPSGPAYEPIARKLADGLEKYSGRRPAIRPDTAPIKELRAGPIISLGNLMDSRLGRRLYLDAYDFTDYAWPSIGGHVIRTIRDPLGTGAAVLVVGGSAPKGVADAAAELLSLVEATGPRLGYVNRVKLGRLASEIQSYTKSLLGEDPASWSRVGGSGSWDYQVAIARAALGYLRTGDESYLPLFRRELRHWFDHDVFRPGTEARPMLHGFLNTILIPWDLAADHPSFSAQERRRIDVDFLAAFRSKEGPDRIANESRKLAVRSNHSTRTGLDAYFGGRYFLRRYNVDDAGRWLTIADGMFAPMLDSSKPGEDSWGHQWNASLLNTLVYALAADKQGYFSSSALGQAAGRALIAHPYGSAPFGYLAACAVATGDTGYMSSFSEAELGHRGAAMRGQGDEYLRSFVTGLPVKPRQDLLGVAVAPLAPLWYETYEGGPKGNAFFVVNQPLQACFDKISIREGWGPGDFYLLLDGISGGVHAYQDANCIVRLSDQAVLWATGAAGATTSATVRSENGVFVALDAAGPGQVHRYARRLYAGGAGRAVSSRAQSPGGNLGSQWLAAGAALEALGEVDWQRHILRRRGRWTLVVDMALPKRAGELLFERHWHSGARLLSEPDGLTWQVSQRSMHLQTVGVPADGMGGKSDRAEKLRTAVAAGHPVTAAALLHLNRTAAKRDAVLRQTGRALRVEDADGTFFVIINSHRPEGIAIVGRHATDIIGAAPPDLPSYEKLAADAEVRPPSPLLPVVVQRKLPWKELRVATSPITAVACRPNGAMAAGDSAGNVRILSAGQAVVAAKMPSAVISLQFLGDDLLVGEDRGAITRLTSDGKRRWERLIPYQSLPWAYWGEGRSRIREIDLGDLAGGGRGQILLANADRRVYSLDPLDGKELWKAPIEWGVYTAMAVGRYQDQAALVGGTSRPAIHGWCVILGDGGQLLGHYSRPDLTNWSNPSQFCDLRLTDVDGDGQPEAIAGIDTDCRQLVVYKADGKILWDADVAGAAQAVAVRAPAGGQAAEVYCASSAGYVCGFDGRSGKRRFATFLGPTANFLAALPGGHLLAATPTSGVFLIAGDGRLVGRSSIDSEITAVLRPGDHRDDNAVIIGTRDGRALQLGSGLGE